MSYRGGVRAGALAVAGAVMLVVSALATSGVASAGSGIASGPAAAPNVSPSPTPPASPSPSPSPLPTPQLFFTARITPIDPGEHRILQYRIVPASASREIAVQASHELLYQNDTVTPTNWQTVGTVTTDAAGAASLTVSPPVSTYYRLVFAGAPDLAPATSVTVTLGVRYIVTLTPRSTTIRSYARNTRITFRATHRPLTAGETVVNALAGYRRENGRWVLRLEIDDVHASATGVATFPVKLTRPGVWLFKAQVAPTRTHTSAWSNAVTLTVR